MNLFYENYIKTNRGNTFWAHSNTLDGFENHIFLLFRSEIFEPLLNNIVDK